MRKDANGKTRPVDNGMSCEDVTATEGEHPEDFCQRCGGRNVSWSVPSDRFNMACNRGEIVCPTCFILAHQEATGMRCSWELVPATAFRWIDDEGRPTPFLGATDG